MGQICHYHTYAFYFESYPKFFMYFILNLTKILLQYGLHVIVFTKV